MIAALELFGAADLARNLEPEIWAKSGATIRIGSPPLQVDVLLQLSGVSYDLVVRSAMTRDLRLRRICVAQGLELRKLGVGCPAPGILVDIPHGTVISKSLSHLGPASHSSPPGRRALPLSMRLYLAGDHGVRPA